MWSKHRGDEKLLARLVEITEARFSPERGTYGEVGARTVIKDCGIIKDVKIGTDAYVKGANKLKNITILSSSDEKLRRSARASSSSTGSWDTATASSTRPRRSAS